MRMRERGARMRGAGGGHFFFVADGDKDGELTQSEWADFLAQADSDGDGVVDNLPFGDRRPPEGAPRHRMGQLLDRDGDGELQTSELEAFFAEHDTNGDGALTRDEVWRHRPGGPGADPGN